MRKSIGWIFLCSVLVFVLLSGVEIGKTLENKNHRKNSQRMTEKEFIEAVQGKQEVMNTPEGVRVYLLEWDMSQVTFAVANFTGVKIHEISIENVEVDGTAFYSDSYLDGVETSKYAICKLQWEIPTQKSEATEQFHTLAGTLFVRGPEVYGVSRIELER